MVDVEIDNGSAATTHLTKEQHFEKHFLHWFAVNLVLPIIAFTDQIGEFCYWMYKVRTDTDSGHIRVRAALSMDRAFLFIKRSELLVTVPDLVWFAAPDNNPSPWDTHKDHQTRTRKNILYMIRSSCNIDIYISTSCKINHEYRQLLPLYVCVAFGEPISLLHAYVEPESNVDVHTLFVIALLCIVAFSDCGLVPNTRSPCTIVIGVRFGATLHPFKSTASLDLGCDLTSGLCHASGHHCMNCHRPAALTECD